MGKNFSDETLAEIKKELALTNRQLVRIIEETNKISKNVDSIYQDENRPDFVTLLMFLLVILLLFKNEPDSTTL